MKQITGTRTVITKGFYAYEVGTGYSFTPSPGRDLSLATRGRYEGYAQPCQLEIPDDGRLESDNYGEVYLMGGPWPTSVGPMAGPLTANEAISTGIARIS